MPAATTRSSRPSKPYYLGPMIIARRDRPVRVKFVNMLPTGSGGNLFLPVDTTLDGAGTGPLGGAVTYTQNRAVPHLHGGHTPWISDGTPYQWITPKNDTTPYPKGVSVQNVPDMADPGPGAMTFFYTNQQSARLLWVHDHAVAMTRLNVYSGEAMPYEIQDPVERGLVTGGVIPADEIPLIIQDKTFVPGDVQLAAQDPTWDKAKWGGLGSLWFPHVYMPNQNPGRHHRSGADGPVGLRPVVLATIYRPDLRADPEPVLRAGAHRGSRRWPRARRRRVRSPRRSWTRRSLTGRPTRL